MLELKDVFFLDISHEITPSACVSTELTVQINQASASGVTVPNPLAHIGERERERRGERGPDFGKNEGRGERERGMYLWSGGNIVFIFFNFH